MKDVREIPGQVFREVTKGRPTETHKPKIETCDMDYGLWLRLKEDQQTYDTRLTVIWAFRKMSGAAVAAADFFSSDDGLTMLSTFDAGRFHTGGYSENDYQFEQTIGLLIPRETTRFSRPESAAGMIHGLRLTHEIAVRSFALLAQGEYDKKKYWSNEVDFN